MRMFKCKDLFLLESLNGMQCLAGESGLSHMIRWTYVAETTSIVNWVKGGELLIVSGAVINQEKFELESMILEATHLGLAGALLLKGDGYITHVSKKVIELANKYNFPLFLISWDVPLVGILEDIGRAVVGSNQLEKRDTMLLSDLLFHEHIDKELIGDIEWNESRIFVINCCNMEESMICRVQDLCMELLGNHRITRVSMIYRNNVIVMVSQDIRVVIQELICEIDKIVLKNNYKIGVGNFKTEMNKIKESFHEALGAIRLSSMCCGDREACFYEELGFLSLLFELGQKDQLSEYSNRILEKLIVYDEENKGSLLLTLKAYFQCNGNLYKSAEQIFVHVNTFKYRLKRINEITGINLENEKQRLDLQTAITIREFLER